MGTEIPHTIKLEYPIEFGKETITEILIARRMRVGDLSGVVAENQTADDMMTVASRLCEQPMKVIKTLDLVDWSKVIAIVKEFMVPFQETGSE